MILESEWVLRFAYGFQPNEICMAFRMLLGLPNVHVGHDQAIAQALNWHELGSDFADAFHLALSQTCRDFYTFDAKFARRAKGLSDCNVQQL